MTSQGCPCSAAIKPLHGRLAVSWTSSHRATRHHLNMLSLRSSCLTFCLTGAREKTRTRTFTELTPVRLYLLLLALTLRLIVSVSVLPPGVLSARQQQSSFSLASRTIQADVVVEGRVERVLSRSDRTVLPAVIVLRVLTLYKGRPRRLRRRTATSVNRLRLIALVDALTSLQADRPNTDDSAADDGDNNNDADSRIMTSLTRRGARLIVFLRHRRGATMSADRDVTFAGRRRRQRRRTVGVCYRVFTSPAAVTESVRKTVEKYSRRRNGEYSSYIRVQHSVNLKHLV